MSLLQYTSNEMFSSTELVRKSKNIFDKLNAKEIEKAIILRDGKPNTILLDFSEYERIMTDYLKLKGELPNQNYKITEEKEEKTDNRKKDLNSSIKEYEDKNEAIIKSFNDINKNDIIDELTDNHDIIDDEDYQAALEKIDNLDFYSDVHRTKREKEETLQEFWDKD